MNGIDLFRDSLTQQISREFNLIRRIKMTTQQQTSAETNSVQHDTVVIKRHFEATPSCVFAAFADVDARKRWAVPQGDKLEYEQANFSVGGRDAFRCGSPNDMSYLGDIRYEDIVPNRRIVFTETMSQLDSRLSATLITVELLPDENGTQLIMTSQIAAFDGSDMATGYREGWLAVFDNLATELRRTES
jgi:uncharacterized protein YndB with AHSA1/START domain